MNFLKRIAVKQLLINLILLTVIVYSQDYNMNIKLKDGTIITYSLKDIKNLQFRDITSGINDDTQEQVIENFQLKQNHPNPFNPSTVIEYQIPQSGNVCISVFDVRGNLVKELINDSQNQGMHQVTWDGTNQLGLKVSSGIYFYSLQFGNQHLARQLLLLK